jgi:putative endonuclease
VPGLAPLRLSTVPTTSTVIPATTTVIPAQAGTSQSWRGAKTLQKYNPPANAKLLPNTQTGPMPREPHVYILTNRPNGTLYVGVTSNLTQRLHCHRTSNKNSFTSRYGLTQLVYYEPHNSMLEAIQREKAIKKWRRRWKIKLIESINPEWNDLSK